jgi:uncharacterized membrane protein
MLNLAAVAAIAGLLVVAPAFTTSAQATETRSDIKLAQAGVTVRIGEPGYRHRHRNHRHWRDSRACLTKVIYRNGSKTVVKRCR